jgi:2-amino-4-hydroxy-6-hydroxymethyldihydropteridine diphosphokinase
MEKVWLGLGSNRGDSTHILASAVQDLSRILSDMHVSGLWRSRARYYEKQEDFYNMAVSGTTTLSPRQLLDDIHGIEAHYGRNRSREISKGPRTLDIDILLYGGKIITEADLIIPHPGLAERKFALLPLLEIDPSLIHPVLGVPLRMLAASLPPQGIYPAGESQYDEPYPE